MAAAVVMAVEEEEVAVVMAVEEEEVAVAEECKARRKGMPRATTLASCKIFLLF